MKWYRTSDTGLPIRITQLMNANQQVLVDSRPSDKQHGNDIYQNYMSCDSCKTLDWCKTK